MDFEQLLSGKIEKDYISREAPYEEQIGRAATFLKGADAVLIGAGAGLSTAAGIVYGGKRFTENFGEFIRKYGARYMTDMYSAGFYPFPTEEARWGYWSKHSMVNRILPDAMPLYRSLYQLVKEKEYFVLTTNVDHQFWKAGFQEKYIFATQGDYGQIQCARGCHAKNYDAVELFRQMDSDRKDCLAPTSMVPRCPVCGGPMDMHLRKDQFFIEDEQWHSAAKRYEEFIGSHRGKKVVLLELGVGFNTPAIIRFPFEKMMRQNPNWTLIRLNLDEAAIPEQLEKRAVGINADLADSIPDLCDALQEEPLKEGALKEEPLKDELLKAESGGGYGTE